MRRVAVCLNCGEPREIAALGLCFKCYRQQERRDDRKLSVVDRHNPALRREHKKIFRGLTSVMVGLSDLGVGTTDVLTIRGLIQPYLSPIEQFLASPRHTTETLAEVNSEQANDKLFTVHTPSGARQGRKRDGEAKSDDVERKKEP
jgi:hypothetical protein